MTTIQSVFDGPGWDREQVSLRLTLRRKTRLLSLARELPPEATPTDAVDRAIDLAVAGLMSRGRGDEDALDANDLFTALDRIDSGVAASAALLDGKMETLFVRLSEIAKALPLIEDAAEGARQLRQLMGEAQSGEAYSSEAGDDASPPALRDWLRRETTDARLSVEKLVIVRAEWAAARRTSRLLLSIDFSCRLVAVDGHRVGIGSAPASPARVDLVEADSALARVGAANVVCFSAEPRGSGAWLVRFHELGRDGKIGALIASIEA